MLVHALPGGGYARCRASKQPCPYGGPVGQTLTRQRTNADGEVSPKPTSDLPVVTIGYGANDRALKATAESLNVLPELPEPATAPAKSSPMSTSKTPLVSWMSEDRWNSLSNKDKTRAIDEEAQRIADALGIGWVDEGWTTKTVNVSEPVSVDKDSKTLTVSKDFLKFSKFSEVFLKLSEVLKNLFSKVGEK